MPSSSATTPWAVGDRPISSLPAPSLLLFPSITAQLSLDRVVSARRVCLLPVAYCITTCPYMFVPVQLVALPWISCECQQTAPPATRLCLPSRARLGARLPACLANPGQHIPCLTVHGASIA